MKKKQSVRGGERIKPVQGSLFGPAQKNSFETAGAVDSSGSINRKMQVSNGYYLNPEQMSRVIHAIKEHGTVLRIKREVLVDATGLADRNVESVVSIGAAGGLIKPSVQLLTFFGELIAAFDPFLEAKGTLLWIHYKGAGTFRNLVWFDLFNDLLPEYDPMTVSQWIGWFRERNAGKYSERTIRKVVQEEVGFIKDAYLEHAFAGLKLLEQDIDGNIKRRRYLEMDPLLFSAMLYDFLKRNGIDLIGLEDLVKAKGSPALLFGLDGHTLRGIVESIHGKGWVRYETTHSLDQVRRRPGFDWKEFLTAYYEKREPEAQDGPGGSSP